MTKDILSPGEKIKKLREDMGLNQEDLASDKVTRSLISMIENGKRKLTYNSAMVIADKLNQYYEPLGKEITAEYLMESETEQARQFIYKEMKKYKDVEKNVLTFSSEQLYLIFDPLIKLAKEWLLKGEISEILFLRGQYYFYLCEYYKAIQDYFSALEYYIETQNYAQIALSYLKIGANSYMLQHYQEALMYLHKAYHIASEKNTENKTRIFNHTIFNITLCYRKLKNYNMVFEYINILKKMDIPSRMSDNVILIEANNYLDLGMLDKAEKLYLKLLKKDLCHETKMLVLDSMTHLYLKKGLCDKALEYAVAALELKEKVERRYVAMITITAAKSYHKVKQSEKAIQVIRNFLQNVKSPAVEKIDVFIQLAEIYKDIEKYQTAEKILYETIHLIKSSGIEWKLTAVYALLCEIYEKTGNREKFSQYLNEIKTL